jgi:hypothetical protein
MNRNKKLGIGVGTIIVVSVLILGYLGFVPILSDLMGSTKPGDLGVKYTTADYDSAIKKLNITVNTISSDEPPVDSIIISKIKPISTSLTSAELTAFLNNLANKWKFCPINNIQVLIHQDGTVELQGTLLPDRFDGFAEAIKMPDSLKNQITPYLAVIKTNPPLYMKGSFSITNGEVQSLISKIQIGKVDIPADEVQKIQTSFSTFLQNIARPPRNLLRNVSFGNGVVNIDGSMPTEVDLSPP